MTTTNSMRINGLLVGIALLTCISAPSWATGSPVVDVAQIAVENQVLEAVQSVADNQKVQLKSTNTYAQVLTVLLTRIEANQQTLIKQNAATQKLLGQMMLQQAQQPMLKGGM